MKMRRTFYLFLLLFCTTVAFSQKYVVNYTDGKYEKALRYAEKAIDENSHDLDAHLIRSMAYVHLYLHVDTRPDYPTGPVIALLGLKSIQRKDKSGEFLLRHTAEQDSILQAAYSLAEEWTEKKQFARAGRLLEDMIEYAPDPEYYYLSGRIAEAQGDHAASIEKYNAAASKIWFDAEKGIQPDAAMYAMFADLADAIAEDDDLTSALVLYDRGMRLFNNADISTRCYALIDAAMQTYMPGFDTTFTSGIIAFLDSMPPATPFWSDFQGLKWQGIMHNYKVSHNVWSDLDRESARQRLVYFACRDVYMPAADTLMAEMFRNTRLLINARGASVTRSSDELLAWKQIYACAQDITVQEVETELTRQFRQYLERSDFESAAKLIYNMAGAEIPDKTMQQAQKELFENLQKASAEKLQQTDLYAMSLMFPANAVGRKLQKDGSVQKISVLLDKKDYSGAGVKLRAQMQLDPGDATIRALYKKWIVEDYVTHFMGSATYTDLESWNGSSEACSPGTLPDSVHAKVLERLNYVRRLAGVADNCLFNANWNAQCMEAALMMQVNGALSHHPSKDWICYSADGAAAASMSNLSLGYGGSEALMGQMDDDGVNNEAVGHRRWILNPYRKVFGHGSNPNSMALWALGGENADQPQTDGLDALYVAWPSAWYFPASLLPYRWSLSRSGADFTEATVEMYAGNKKLELQVLPVSYGYGLPTLVWEPALEWADPGKELTVKVVVKNIRYTGAWDESAFKYTQVPEDYTYTVTLMPMF